MFDFFLMAISTNNLTLKEYLPTVSHIGAKAKLFLKYLIIVKCCRICLLKKL